MREAKGKFALGAFLKKHLLYAIALGLAILSLLLVSLYLLLSNMFSASQTSVQSSSASADSALTVKESRQLAAELSADFAPLPLDPDELFPPEEPDFLPRVLLSREPRDKWGVEDTAPFWTDPATLDGAALRYESKGKIDALMGTVP